jgi:hypothetical protein
MVSKQHPKPLDVKQEITNYAVAVPKLSNPPSSIIDALYIQSRKKVGEKINHNEDHYLPLSRMWIRPIKGQ